MKAHALLRRYRHRRKQRGAALIMVILAIVVLTVFLGEIQRESSAAFGAALAARDRLKAEYHARSAINLSRLLIATEPSIRRAVTPMFMLINQGKGKVPQIPVWEFADQVLGVFNDASGNSGFSSLAGVDANSGENLGLGSPGRFELVIVDEDAKINVNTAARGDIISLQRLSQQLLGLMAGQQYDAMFQQLDADGQPSDRATICGALIDWADADENMHPCDPYANSPVGGGAEDNFYQTIGLPYLRKNAGYDSLQELMLVRGISDDFWTTFVDPDPRNPRKRVLTVWGQGQVNVNTANAQTLLGVVCGNAVPEQSELCVDPIQMATFLSTVSLLRSFTAGAPLFTSAKDFIATMKGGGMLGPMMSQMGIKPVVFRSESEVKKQVSTESKVFSLYAEGVVPRQQGEARVGIHAVVDFRTATPVPGAMPAAELAGATPLPGSGAPASDGENTAETVLASVNANPGGKVIYFRVD